MLDLDRVIMQVYIRQQLYVSSDRIPPIDYRKPVLSMCALMHLCIEP